MMASGVLRGAVLRRELRSVLFVDAADGLALVVDRVEPHDLLQEPVELGARRRVQRDVVQRLEQIYRKTKQGEGLGQFQANG